MKQNQDSLRHSVADSTADTVEASAADLVVVQCQAVWAAAWAVVWVKVLLAVKFTSPMSVFN